MGYIIAFASQKGGVGKSTLARLLAREFAANGLTVKIADLDVSQGTATAWNMRRMKNGITPAISVEPIVSVQNALKEAGRYDVLIFDGTPQATKTTLEVAKVADLVVIPTGLAVDDLEPSVRLAHELKREGGINPEKIAFALSKVGDSAKEILEVRSYLKETGYWVMSSEIPDKTAFRRASDVGLALTETKFPSLNKKADALAQAIIERLAQLEKERAA